MRDIDKQAMGARIREIRATQGLRQREIADLLGTTQSAVHKYEHGVVPEPRRLMELARVGETTIEWILTGRHGDDGDVCRERPSADVLRTAALLREVTSSHSALLAEALTVLREASRAVQDGKDPLRTSDAAVIRAELRENSAAALRILEAAWRIQRALTRRVLSDAQERLESAPLPPREDPTE